MSVGDRDEVWTVVVAGGSGSRFGRPKQFEDLGGRTVLEWAVDAARRASDGVVIVVPASEVSGPHTVAGGATRSESVRNGLSVVPATAGVVCIHDAARPFAGPDLFASVIAAVRSGADGAVPGVPVTDTIKVVDEHGVVTATPNRDSLVAVQTPQAFSVDALRRAHAAGADGTDDATLVESTGGRVVVVTGDPMNRKITLPDDLVWARTLVTGR